LPGAMRAAEERVAELGERPTGALGAGAGGKVDPLRPLGRLRRRRHEPILPDSCSSVGRSVPARGLLAQLWDVNASANPPATLCNLQGGQPSVGYWAASRDADFVAAVPFPS